MSFQPRVVLVLGSVLAFAACKSSGNGVPAGFPIPNNDRIGTEERRDVPPPAVASEPTAVPVAESAPPANHGQEHAAEVHEQNEERKAEHDAAQEVKKEEKAEEKAEKQEAKEEKQDEKAKGKGKGKGKGKKGG